MNEVRFLCVCGGVGVGGGVDVVCCVVVWRECEVCVLACVCVRAWVDEVYMCLWMCRQKEKMKDCGPKVIMFDLCLNHRRCST
jgi:hypothetical protein